MKSASEKLPQNRLMQAMIFVSLGIHLLILLHVSGLYRSEALSYIELSLQDVSKPFSRTIPRPRVRQTAPEVHEVKAVDFQKVSIPQIKLDPADNQPKSPLMETIGIPDIPSGSPQAVSGVDFGVSTEFVTAEDYFEMLRLKIEARKKYPEEARVRHIEGKTNVRFIITKDGQVSSLTVLKSSGSALLDEAALEAVTNAAPFPKPASNLFKATLYVEIAIVFELT